MLRAREHYRSNKGTNRARHLFLLSLVFAISVGAASYFKEDGIQDLIDSDRKVERQRMEQKRLEAENSLLRRRIKSIYDDSYLVEKFAREKLHLVKENEIVFRFYDEPPLYK